MKGYDMATVDLRLCCCECGSSLPVISKVSLPDDTEFDVLQLCMNAINGDELPPPTRVAIATFLLNHAVCTPMESVAAFPTSHAGANGDTPKQDPPKCYHGVKKLGIARPGKP